MSVCAAIQQKCCPSREASAFVGRTQPPWTPTERRAPRMQPFLRTLAKQTKNALRKIHGRRDPRAHEVDPVYEHKYSLQVIASKAWVKRELVKKHKESVTRPSAA